nr:flagellin lysine-N-methylase [Lysinibacillus sphaericus]
MDKMILVPKGVENFQCIGAACEDHCCKMWNVNIDRVGFMKVTTSSNPVIKPIAKKVYQKNLKATSDANYGHMKMNEQRECYFLDENKYCLIHKELGESALCNTCAIYPREHREVGPYIEKSLTLSCPEAVRTLLLQLDGIEFEEVFAQPSERIQSKAFLDGEHVDILWAIRSFVINLLQERSISLDLRMMLLGLLAEKLNERPKTLEHTEQVIQMMQQRFLTPQYIEAVMQIKGNELVQLQMHKELLRTTVEELSFNVRYIEVVNQFIRGLQTGPLENKEITEETLQKYIAAQAVYQQFIKEHHYILENYLVHYIFTNVFPYNGKTVLEAYEDVVINYQLIKALLIGIASYNGNLTVNDVVLAIQSYTKAVAHNNKSYGILRQKIKESNMETIAFLFAYIKTNG